MGKLDMADRKSLPQNAFAVPSKAPGPGAYPIPDKAHAANAEARASGKPVQGQVAAAVKAKFPGLGAQVQNQPGESMDSMADRLHPTA
jgi:hypothetical protein